jgi:hypothetical protein
MDIVKITMFGYGCEIGRGTVKQKYYKKLKNLDEEVWQKNLIKKLKEDKDVEIKIISEDYGIIKGDIKIEVEDDVIMDTQIITLDILNEDIVKNEVIHYPDTKDIVITTVQHLEGVICDILFVIDGKFDLDKLKLVRKDIVYNVDNPLVTSLYCELYYDNEMIPLTDPITDLRNSRLYLEKLKK